MKAFPLFAAFLLSLAAARSASAEPRMLLIGDSHTVGPFGHELDARLRAAYPRRPFETYASCGAAPSWYLPGNAASGHTSPCGTWFHKLLLNGALEDVTTPRPTPLIGDLLKSNPDVVIVALGTNMGDWTRGGAFGMDSAAALAKTIKDSGALCLWIGPPDGLGHLTRERATALVARLNSEIKKAVGPYCGFSQSRTTYQGADGLHYFPEPAKAWADQAAEAIRKVLDAQSSSSRSAAAAGGT